MPANQSVSSMGPPKVAPLIILWHMASMLRSARSLQPRPVIPTLCESDMSALENRACERACAVACEMQASRLRKTVLFCPTGSG